MYITKRDPVYKDVRFPSVESVFDLITEKVGKEKVVLVINELPYWAEKDEALLLLYLKLIKPQ